MSNRPASLKDYNLFFFDCETGGLDAKDHDMVQVAAILTDPSGQNVLEEYEAKVLPRKPVNMRAAAINGYSTEKWAAANATPIDGPLVKMLAMARNALFVAHNASFDWAFFEAAIKERPGARWQSDYHKYDTVAMAIPLLRHGLVDSLKLTVLTKYFGIEHSNAHDALSDVRACRALYLKMQSIYDLDPVVQKLRSMKAETYVE